MHQFKNIILIVVVIVTFCSQNNVGQIRLFDMSGIVADDENRPIPYVQVYNVQTNKSTNSDINGIFNLIVRGNDTITMVCIGFKPSLFIVPDTLTGITFTPDIMLMPDTIWLNSVTIYPWRNYEEFKKALLALHLKEKKNNEKLEKNINIMKSRVLLADIPDPVNSYNMVMREHFYQVEHKEMIGTYNILNPFKWAEFINALSDGSLWSGPDLRKKQIRDAKPPDAQ
jgi:hypothetical protein